VRPEGFSKLKTFVQNIGSRTHDLPACNIVPPHSGQNPLESALRTCFPFIHMLLFAVKKGFYLFQNQALSRYQIPPVSNVLAFSFEPYCEIASIAMVLVLALGSSHSHILLTTRASHSVYHCITTRHTVVYFMHNLFNDVP
jgi:hypothetical protein